MTLTNREGGKSLVEKEHKEILTILGAEFEDLSADISKKLDINGGVKVNKLHAGKLRKHTDMRVGFIITKVDGQEVHSVNALIKALEQKDGGVMLEGVYEDIPGVYYYAFGIGM